MEIMRIMLDFPPGCVVFILWIVDTFYAIFPPHDLYCANSGKALGWSILKLFFILISNNIKCDIFQEMISMKKFHEIESPWTPNSPSYDNDIQIWFGSTNFIWIDSAHISRILNHIKWLIVQFNSIQFTSIAVQYTYLVCCCCGEHKSMLRFHVWMDTTMCSKNPMHLVVLLIKTNVWCHKKRHLLWQQKNHQ